eukprot:370223_1
MASSEEEEKLLINVAEIKKSSSSKQKKKSTQIRRQFIYFLVSIVMLIGNALILLTNSDVAYALSGLLGLLIALYGCKHFYTLLGLKASVDQMSTLNLRFRVERNRLSKEVPRFQSGKKELQLTKKRIKYQKRQAFLSLCQEMCTSMDALNFRSLEDIINAIPKTKVLKQKWSAQLFEHQRYLLQTLFERSVQSYLRGMSKTEYDQFLSLMPSYYKTAFKKMGSFDVLSGGKDFIHYDDIMKLVDLTGESVFQNEILEKDSPYLYERFRRRWHAINADHIVYMSDEDLSDEDMSDEDMSRSDEDIDVKTEDIVTYTPKDISFKDIIAYIPSYRLSKRKKRITLGLLSLSTLFIFFGAIYCYIVKTDSIIYSTITAVSVFISIYMGILMYALKLLKKNLVAVHSLKKDAINKRSPILKDVKALMNDISSQQDLQNNLLESNNTKRDLIKQYEQLKNNLQTLNTDKLINLGKLNGMISKWEEDLIFNERDILRTVFERYATDSGEMIATSFDEFIQQLPFGYMQTSLQFAGAFKKISHDGINITWDDLKGSGLFVHLFGSDIQSTLIMKKTIRRPTTSVIIENEQKTNMNENEEIVQKLMTKHKLEVSKVRQEIKNLDAKCVPLSRYSNNDICNKIKFFLYNDVNYHRHLEQAMETFSKNLLNGTFICSVSTEIVEKVIQKDFLTFMTQDTFRIMMDNLEIWKNEAPDEIKTYRPAEISYNIFNYPLKNLLKRINDVNEPINGEVYIKYFVNRNPWIKNATGWNPNEVHQINSMLFKAHCFTAKQISAKINNFTLQNDVFDSKISNIICDKIHEYDLEQLHFKIKNGKDISDFSDTITNMIDDLAKGNDASADNFVKSAYEAVADCFAFDYSKEIKGGLRSLDKHQCWICNNCSNFNFHIFVASNMKRDLSSCTLCGIKQRD